MEDINLILPKYKVESDSKTIFLAGPMKGAPKWQDRAIEIIDRLDKNVLIASPSKKVRPEYCINQLVGKGCYNSQLDWERFYLEKAAKSGCILFWLPNQFEEMQRDVYTGFHGPYARDTRGELGEWRGRMLHEKVNIVIGAEDNFPGLDIITRNFLALKSDFKIYSSLEETCRKAVNISNN